MQLSDYREKARQYAVYQDPDYPRWMVAEEVGELIGLFAKKMRGDYAEIPRDSLVKECGDILWGLALASPREWEMNLEEKPRKLYHPEFELSALHNEVNTLLHAEHSEDFYYAWENCCIVLKFFAQSCGLDIDEVANTNLAKLASRQQRGQIQGSGDER